MTPRHLEGLPRGMRAPKKKAAPDAAERRPWPWRLAQWTPTPQVRPKCVNVLAYPWPAV
jgi:hypothetical protein